MLFLNIYAGTFFFFFFFCILNPHSYPRSSISVQEKFICRSVYVVEVAIRLKKDILQCNHLCNCHFCSDGYLSELCHILFFFPFFI